MNQVKTTTQVLMYCALVAVLSTPFWICCARYTMKLPIVMALMWCPAVAALLCTRIFKQPIRSLGFRWGGWGNAGIGYVVPIAYGLLAYGVAWALGIGRLLNMKLPNMLASKFPTASTATLVVIAAVAIGVVWELTGGAVAATGEEIGWRGYLTPLLVERYGWRKASLITGLIWGAWHYPVILFSTYHTSAPLWYNLLCFTAMTVALSFLFTWLRLRSASVWPCVLLHASHNAWVQLYFDPLTIPGAHSQWWLTNTGAMLPLAVSIFTVALLGVKRNAGVSLRESRL